MTPSFTVRPGPPACPFMVVLPRARAAVGPVHTANEPRKIVKATKAAGGPACWQLLCPDRVPNLAGNRLNEKLFGERCRGLLDYALSLLVFKWMKVTAEER